MAIDDKLAFAFDKRSMASEPTAATFFGPLLSPPCEIRKTPFRHVNFTSRFGRMTIGEKRPMGPFVFHSEERAIEFQVKTV